MTLEPGAVMIADQLCPRPAGGLGGDDPTLATRSSLKVSAGKLQDDCAVFTAKPEPEQPVAREENFSKSRRRQADFPLRETETN